MTLNVHVLYILSTWFQTASRAVHAWFRVHYTHRTPKTTKKELYIQDYISDEE
jgi:hypothetical protein